MTESEFPLDDSLVYLNHAAVSPWPRRTAETVKAFADENLQRGSQHYEVWLGVEQSLREQLQRLINADMTSEIALLKNTSEALSVVAYGLDWKPGDNVVISNQEFPSNRIVWESLQRYGVETQLADIDQGPSPEAALVSKIDANTRLVSVSSVQYGTGLRLDLAVIGAACRARGILFCVDAIQSLGAVGLDVQDCQADFVMADAHKWLLGPEGIALFYCRQPVMDQLGLKQYGWHMVEDLGNFDNKHWEIAGSARRFECGSPNMTGIHALHASLSLIHETGMPLIEKQVMANSRYLIDYFMRHDRDDYRLVTPVADDRHAGIVTFIPLRESTQRLYTRLQQANVICAMRGGGIRFSPHFYTPVEKLDQALHVVSHTSS